MSEEPQAKRVSKLILAHGLEPGGEDIFNGMTILNTYSIPFGCFFPPFFGSEEKSEMIGRFEKKSSESYELHVYGAQNQEKLDRLAVSLASDSSITIDTVLKSDKPIDPADFHLYQ